MEYVQHARKLYVSEVSQTPNRKCTCGACGKDSYVDLQIKELGRKSIQGTLSLCSECASDVAYSINEILGNVHE